MTWFQKSAYCLFFSHFSLKKIFFLFYTWFLSEIIVLLQAVLDSIMRKTSKPVDPNYLECPIRNVIEKFGDKWSLLVLYHLDAHGTMRFNSIHRDMSDCSQKMLSQTLKRLEKYHLISRKLYPEVPPRVEYSLTETGKSLMPHLQGLIDWAISHAAEMSLG